MSHLSPHAVSALALTASCLLAHAPRAEACEASASFTPSPSPDTAPATRWRFDPGALALTHLDSGASFSLEPTFEVAHIPGVQAPSSARARRRASAMKIEDRFHHDGESGRFYAGVVMSGEQATASFRVQGERSSPYLEVVLTVTYHEDVSVVSEELSLSFDEAEISALDHAMRPITLSSSRPRHHLPSHIPRRIAVARDSARLRIDAPGIPGVMLRRAKRAQTITFELDHRDHHPFKLYASCPDTRAYPSRWLDQTPRRAGESVTYRALIGLGTPSMPSPRRYPRGYNAAISMTDHADQASVERTRAFAYGGEGESGSSGKGFVGRGLSYSKSVFTLKRGGYKGQLSHEGFTALFAEMVEDGVEPGLHSVSGKTDTREESEREVARFARDFPLAPTWIDHGPERNCEALSNQGWDKSSPYHVADVLLGSGIDTWWAVKDLSVVGGRLDLLATASPERRRAVLYPLERLRQRVAPFRTPLMFASAWFFQDRRPFLRRFSTSNLDRLRDDHGLLLAHTYLDVYARSGKFATRTLLESSDGSLRLRDEADEVFARIAAYQDRGEILTGGVGRLGPHLVESLALDIRPHPDGGYIVSHGGAHALEGVTLRVYGEVGEVRVDGEAPRGTRRVGEGWVDVWFDMAPGDVRRVEGVPDASARGVSVEVAPGT